MDICCFCLVNIYSVFLWKECAILLWGTMPYPTGNSLCRTVHQDASPSLDTRPARFTLLWIFNLEQSRHRLIHPSWSALMSPSISLSYLISAATLVLFISELVSFLWACELPHILQITPILLKLFTFGSYYSYLKNLIKNKPPSKNKNKKFFLTCFKIF